LTDVNLGTRLRDKGYLWHISPEDAAKLTPNDDAFKTALTAYQNFYAIDFADRCSHFHGRAGIADGELGPASESLLTHPGRNHCHVPDHAPPADAVIQYADERLQKIAESMRGRHEGHGSWPAGCHDEVWDGHVVKIAYDKSRFPRAWLNVWPQVQANVFANFRTFGLLMREEPDPVKADIRMQARNGAGWIGLAEFPRGTCDGWVFQYMDPGWTPRALVDGLSQLHAHECGHNLSLGHRAQNSRTVMSPTISWPSTGFRGFVPGDPSWNQLQGYFRDEGFTPMPGGDDPIPDDRPELAISGTIDGHKVKLVYDDDGDDGELPW